MRILYLTRKFPPSTGGMETASFELWKSLSRSNDVYLVASGLSVRWIAVTMPYLLTKGLVGCITHKPDVIYVQDGVLAPIGRLIGWITQSPTVITIHGLEVTYGNVIYRHTILPWIGRQSVVVAVSRATADAMSVLFPNRADPTVIANGVSERFPQRPNRSDARRFVLQLIDVEVDDHRVKLIHTNGRLVRRKGVAWFVRHVFPLLKRTGTIDVHYLISGTGPEEKSIVDAISDAGLEGHVHLLGGVSDSALATLYAAADLFVMPNLQLESDFEGFGLVAVEAASFGTPVIASDVEGIRDAVINGENGILVPCGDVQAYRDTILAQLLEPSFDRTSVRAFTIRSFSWEKTAEQYLSAFRRAIASTI